MLHTRNEFMMVPCACHVCGRPVKESENGIEHSGTGQYQEGERNLKTTYVSIWLHPECATVLMLRIAKDIMQIRHNDPQKRVVDVLQDQAKAIYPKE